MILQKVRNTRKTIAGLLAAAMLVALLPMSVLAEGPDAAAGAASASASAQTETAEDAASAPKADAQAQLPTAQPEEPNASQAPVAFAAPRAAAPAVSATVNFYIRRDGQKVDAETITGHPDGEYAQVGASHTTADFSGSVFTQTNDTAAIAAILGTVPADVAAGISAKYGDGVTADWYVVKNVSGLWHVDGVLLNADDTQTAAITYSAGTTDAVAGMPEDQTFTLGGTAKVSAACPTREGYVFTGWTDADGVVLKAGAVLSKATALTAQWRSIADMLTKKVEFYIHLNGSMDPADTDGAQYSKAMSADNAAQPFTAAYFALNGGNTTDRAAVAQCLNSQPSAATIQGQVKTYNPDTQYMLWYAIKTYGTIHVDGVIRNYNILTYTAGAAGSEAQGLPAGEKIQAGADAAVSTAAPTWAGHTFTGWVLTASADAQVPEIANGRFPTAGAGSETNTAVAYTLTAQWSTNPATSTPTATAAPTSTPAATTPTATPAAPTATVSPVAVVRRRAAATAAPVATATPAPAVIADNETPLAGGTQPTATPEAIQEQDTPLAAAPSHAAWALLNLILMLATVAGSAMLIVTWFTGRQRSGKNAGAQETAKKHGILRIASMVIAAAGIAAFFLTENMSLSMVMTDQWTLLMAAIALVQLAAMFLAKKKYENGSHAEEN